MDTTTFLAILLPACLATVVALVAIQQGTRRAELRNNREHYRDDTMENLVAKMVEMSKGETRGLMDVIHKLLHALTEPINPPTPPTPVHEQELAGQAADAIREFHDGFSGDPVDTPDWTDGWLPDTRGDEPRIASVRPGDSVVPGQGNWDAMMGEGRAVVGDEMVSGEDQWEGEKWDG